MSYIFRLTFIIVAIIYDVVKNVNADAKYRKCEALVRIESGLICGKVRLAENATEYYSFRGVPYGRPPLGKLRFAELEPVPVWEGLYDASEEGPVCPQRDIFYGRIPFQPKGMSEDCIYANIHVPKSTQLISDKRQKYNGTGLPIVVNISGGGFSAGSGNSDLHGPEFFMYSGEVIVITFNYRINVFGFLSLNDCQIPGNNGLRDQLTLLKWVKRNAGYFGGNSDDVTLIGMSAGAMCVHLLSISAASEGLFKRVIIMSGAAISNAFTTLPVYSQYVADGLFELLGHNTSNNDERYHLLTTLPLSEIMAANNILQMQYGMITFAPVSEPNCENFTRVLDNDPLSLIAAGRGKDLPMLIGFVDDEVQFFKWVLNALDMVSRVERNPSIIIPQRMVLSYPDKAMEYVHRINQYYFNGKISIEKIINVLTDSFFQYPAMKVAQWRSAMNAAPVYLYQYSYVSEVNIIKEGIWISYNRTAHCEDLTYVFRTNTIMPKDHISFPPATNDDRMRERMTKMVLNFVQCSNPTCSESKNSPWPPVSADALMYQNIAMPMIYSMEEPTARQRSMIELLDSIDSDMRNVTDYLLSERNSETR